MNQFYAPSSVTAFLNYHGQAKVVNCFLQLLAEEKLRQDGRQQELTQSLAQLQLEIDQQHLQIKQLQQQLDQQTAWRNRIETDWDRLNDLLAAYRKAAQGLNDAHALVNELFKQAFESSKPIESLDLYHEIADTPQADEPAPVRQLRVLSRLNIGVVLATKLSDPRAAREAYQQVQTEYDTDSDPLVQQICRIAREYMADPDSDTPT